MRRSLDELSKSLVADFVPNGSEVRPRPERQHAPQHEVLVLFRIERAKVDVPEKPKRMARDDFGQTFHAKEFTT
jgi:hypothetical protein